MTGEYVSGIYTTGGTVTVDGGTVEVSFAEGKTDKLLTSTAVSTEGGNIAMAGNVRIASESLGITARSGTITIDETADVRLGRSLTESEGSVEVSENLRATGIYVNNGTITNEGTIDLLCAIDDDWNWVNRDGSAYSDFNKYNGVYVQGGSLVSEGTLNVTFTGVENEDQTSHNDDSLIASITNNPTEGEHKVSKDIYDRANQAIKDNQDSNLYQNFQTKSYAVRVEAGTNTTVSTRVIIASGEIKNEVGGGVYVGGGTVTLGKQETTNGIVSTRIEEGWRSDTYYVTLSKYIPLGSGTVTGTWSFAQPLTGGDAVKVVDGTLNVYGGKYDAAQGNGIFVSGAVSGGEGKAVNISGGTFLGYNGGYTNREVTGPAGSYGIKIIGGSVSISNGTFGASSGTSNGAAFFMGTETQTADIDITGGNYYAYNTDAVSTFRYIALNMNNVTVATTVASGTARAAVSVQNDEIYANMENRGAEITIEGGSYSSTNGYGLWYGAGIDKVAIKDGTFTGQNSSGLYFYVQPNDSNVQLSGGKYRGDGSAWGGNVLGSIQTSNLLVTTNDDGTQTLGWLYDLPKDRPNVWLGPWFCRFRLRIKPKQDLLLFGLLLFVRD